MSFVRESVVINGKPLVFETGRLAKQAAGSAIPGVYFSLTLKKESPCGESASLGPLCL